MSICHKTRKPHIQITHKLALAENSHQEDVYCFSFTTMSQYVQPYTLQELNMCIHARRRY